MFGMHPDEIEEQGYRERCEESFRQILRDEHKDYFEDDFEPFSEELTPEYPQDVSEWQEAFDAPDTPF